MADQPTYRMSMLPFGTYPNENGQGEHLGLAVPGMVQEPVNALMNLFGHGNFAKGPDYPGNADDMRTLLFSMYGGNALNPRSLLEGAAANAGPAAERAASNGLRPGLTVTRTAPPGVPSAWHDIALDGDRIGRAYVREYPNTIQNSNFTIEPEFQRQGIGTEVQSELARMYGKPTVPDSMLSEAGYQRWLKNDPAAVADYRPMSEGANSYSPAPLTDAYFASMGGPPVPGSRAAAGELFSDTGRPSLMGSALSPYNQPPRNSLLDY